MHDYTVCDKCGMLVDVGTAIKDRSTALEDGTDKITEHPRYITIEDDDGFVQHFCMKCARDHIDAWLDGDHYGESITISMETGIVLKSVFDRLETERVTYENKKKEEEQQYAKFLAVLRMVHILLSKQRKRCLTDHLLAIRRKGGPETMSDEQYRSVSNSLKPYGTQLREKRLVELRLQELHTQMLA